MRATEPNSTTAATPAGGRSASRWRRRAIRSARRRPRAATTLFIAGPQHRRHRRQHGLRGGDGAVGLGLAQHLVGRRQGIAGGIARQGVERRQFAQVTKVGASIQQAEGAGLPRQDQQVVGELRPFPGGEDEGLQRLLGRLLRRIGSPVPGRVPAGDGGMVEIVAGLAQPGGGLAREGR
ncbi:hypothetical protein GCM10009099_38840 [Caenispirillum bisanense]